jgi:hypothetical protein
MKYLRSFAAVILFFFFIFFICAQEQISDIGKNDTESLKELIQNGKNSLQKLLSSPSTDEITNSMKDLGVVIYAATERARRLCDWNLEDIEKEAEQTFDDTINAIEEYLDLIKDNGLVHKATIRIRTSALDLARVYREKASVKSNQKYMELASAMDSQAAQVTEIWETITKERAEVIKELNMLKDSKELYIDTKKALGVKKAVEDLKGIRDDLVLLKSSMEKVQTAILEIKI